LLQPGDCWAAAIWEVDALVSNVEEITAELGTLPDAPKGLSAAALTLAAGLDDSGASLAMKSMAVRELVVTMDRIRELAPPKRQKDFVDSIRDEVADKRARRSTAAAK
jgi:hypothetical protein